MEIADFKRKLGQTAAKIQQFRGSLDFDELQESIAINENKMAQPEFWNDQQGAQQLIEQNNTLKTKLETFEQLQQMQNDLQVALELLQEDPADHNLQQEIETDLQQLEQKMQQYEIAMLLDGPYDTHNAILEIHPGAGGTESQDWGSMLLRMYERWAEQHHFQIEVEDYQSGEEAGLKSVTLMIKGHNAYGLLRSEHGVHRLVRISPFDSAGRRHTSFASVEVMPELDDSITIEVNNDDLRIDVFRSSGAGGQHINKTSSAVRITHLPTGIVTSSQAQRSQLQNRETAMNMLKAKLYQRQLAAQAQKQAQIKGEQLEIGWGSQIRSYVFHPYSMVKDHRTNYETGNGQAVMDGELDPFIYSYLQWKLGQTD
ncbi:peptide chain release factor 2 [Bombilactobacillus thymidiniphilus]|uniref:Peptide chain release factor 2 n=1 Tax=Bombilactobacillus thymidiniphilus TaxID=2923363 RepID=A0ABY4PCD4_9LACO|nr:peptide chain release factor 2 [Bombilactobacillus thymidiniphilus]UQS83309.1 peptide chain release factor 2 [Bombilactobacillus thymidiniphilus]